ncbi:hypothetical protein GP486_005409 [Trichoglossum hirsutum]|uniref:Uncharacterized protein n=1 Tax=Trichoglossum hirsutum TaxID=265104 RepID=A0A9P8L990_9PEZI|nr:hypothetical protein GP486_005409 [Trichoglossum hirsutum]
METRWTYRDPMAIAPDDQAVSRNEYDYEDEKLIIRYPNHYYGSFINLIVNDIATQLFDIKHGYDDVQHRCNDGAAAEIARCVWMYEASRVAIPLDELSAELNANGLIYHSNLETDLRMYGPHRYADAVIRYSCLGLPDPHFPRIVIEASFPPKRKYLPYLAYDYIAISQGRIELVVGLDIGHWGSKKASVSMWQPRSTMMMVKEFGPVSRHSRMILRESSLTITLQYFRLEDGSAVEEGSLTFQLRDFVPPEAADRIAGLDIPISIPYSKLAQYLDFAERNYALRERWREQPEMPTRRPMM